MTDGQTGRLTDRRIHRGYILTIHYHHHFYAIYALNSRALFIMMHSACDVVLVRNMSHSQFVVRLYRRPTYSQAIYSQ